MYLWREGWWRHRAKNDLTGEANEANVTALAKVKAELETLFESWRRFPEEARFWCITFRHGLPECTPEDSFLRWYFKGKTTMESNAKGF